jgi:hypothetical protein
VSASVVFRLLRRCRENKTTACWEFEGYRDGSGHGQIKMAGRAQWAHRVAFAWWNGGLAEGLVVHHTCGNAGCVNPEHLRAMAASHHDGISPEIEGWEVPF